jgi:hypothetical protein
VHWFRPQFGSSTYCSLLQHFGVLLSDFYLQLNPLLDLLLCYILDKCRIPPAGHPFHGKRTFSNAKESSQYPYFLVWLLQQDHPPSPQTWWHGLPPLIYRTGSWPDTTLPFKDRHTEGQPGPLFRAAVTWCQLAAHKEQSMM